MDDLYEVRASLVATEPGRSTVKEPNCLAERVVASRDDVFAA